VEQHRLLLLEGAQQHRPRAVTLQGLAQRLAQGELRVHSRAGVRDVTGWRVHGRSSSSLLVGSPLGYTAHSPSPRITSNGALRSQSMNSFIVGREKSTGIERSLTIPSSSAAPTRWANAPHGSPSWRAPS